MSSIRFDYILNKFRVMDVASIVASIIQGTEIPIIEQPIYTPHNIPGLDDLSSSGVFTSNLSNRYRIVIDGRVLNYENLMLNFQNFETITSSSGGTGVIITDYLTYMTIIGDSIISGNLILNIGDTLTGQTSGATANLTSISDTFEWEGTNIYDTPSRFNPIIIGNFPLENGVNINFGAIAGHTLFDYWDIAVSNPTVMLWKAQNGVDLLSLFNDGVLKSYRRIENAIPDIEVTNETLINKLYADTHYAFTAPNIITSNIIWVDLNGNDVNPGTFESPKATIQGAIDLASTFGTTIMIGNGVFESPTNINKSGIIFKSFASRTIIEGQWVIDGSSGNAISFNDLDLRYNGVNNPTIDILNAAQINIIDCKVIGAGNASDTVIRITNSTLNIIRTESDTVVEDATTVNAILAINSTIVAVDTIFNGVINIDATSLILHTGCIIDRSIAILTGTEYQGDSLANIRAITNTDIEITDFTKGLILKSPDNTRWRITVNNSGTLTTTSL